MTTENTITTYAVEQHGLITKAQVTRERISEASIEAMLKRGALLRVHRGVYRVPTVTPTWHQHALAALYAAGVGAALSHRSAAVAHELQGVDDGGPIHVTVPFRRSVSSKTISVHRTREKLPVTIINGLAVTSLARTLVDLAAVATEEELEIALDHAQRRRRGVLGWLDWAIGQLRQPRRPGMAVLAKLLGWRQQVVMHGTLKDDAWVIQLRRKLERAAATLGASASGPAPTHQLTLLPSPDEAKRAG